ncbi:MAG TPA: c-type cytochrome [Rhodocyclaceae bacterium]|nr:c-type cytochrome [Rhodocyclaceae bacterium]
MWRKHFAVLVGAVSCGLFAGGVQGAETKINLQRAEEIVASRCFLCHGLEGESSSPLFPRLAGQHAEYMAKQLGDFKSGLRASDTMKAQAMELTPDEMKSLGAYFQSKPASANPAEDQGLAEVGRYIFRKGNMYSGVAACVGCHGNKGYGTAQLPRLAGQNAQYLENQLKQFNKRQRTNDNDVMHSIAARLTELEIKGVAEYISTLE